jgi:hypothetical protein
VLCTLVGGAAAACAQPREDASHADAPQCNLRVIVALDGEPTEALLGDLSRASGAKLELVRNMTTNLHLLALTATGPESQCSAAMERLRADPRVRSVDVDQRRQIHQP